MKLLLITPGNTRYVELTGQEYLSTADFRELPPIFADWDLKIPQHKVLEYLGLCKRDKDVVDAYIEMDSRALREKSITEVLYSLKKVYDSLEDWVEDILGDEPLLQYIDKEKYMKDHLHKYPIVGYKRQWYWFAE